MVMLFARFGLPDDLEDEMPYDEALAERIREVLPPTDQVVERKMFGGLAFLLGGHMFCGIVHDEPGARPRRRWRR